MEAHQALPEFAVVGTEKFELNLVGFVFFLVLAPQSFLMKCFVRWWLSSSG